MINEFSGNGEIKSCNARAAYRFQRLPLKSTEAEGQKAEREAMLSSSSPSRCCTPRLERPLPYTACRIAPLVLRPREPSGVPGRYPFLCLCTSSSSSSSSPLPPLSPSFSVTSTTTTTTTTAPVTASGATVVSTTITTSVISPPAGSTSPVVRRRKRYRKAYPGESKGIVEEMRFVAMTLRNEGAKGGEGASGGRGEDGGYGEEDAGKGKEKETWQPSMEGFLKYMVDSKLIFETIERTVDQSEDVACKDNLSNHTLLFYLCSLPLPLSLSPLLLLEMNSPKCW